MDGPAMVTQCPILPGQTFTYDFIVNQPGTYWYHSHVGGQYIDGLRGPIIVHDPAAPYYKDYKIDEEVTMTVADWYHMEAPRLIQYFQSSLNEDLHGGSEPVPNATLINESQNVKFSMKPNKTYLFRIINMGGFAAQFVEFDEHDMDVVEVDGVYTKPHRTTQLLLTAAQRYSVVVKSKPNNNKNFAVITSMNAGMFDEGVIPEGLKSNASAFLVYDDKKPLPPQLDIDYNQKAFDDTRFLPYDNQLLLGPVTRQIKLDVIFNPNSQNQNRGCFNNISYVPQKVPTLYTALSAPSSELANNPLIYGVNSNPYVLQMGEIVELLITNYDGGAHPFHLHSHNFQVVARSGPGPDDGPPLLIPSNFAAKADPSPMRRDTVLIYGSGYAVLRFKVDNPGIALFHCHIEWHVEAGLSMTFVEAPDQLRALGLKIPDGHEDACKKGKIPMKGNAAGNSRDWLDLTGALTEPPINAWGALLHPPADPVKRVVRSRLGAFFGGDWDVRW